MRVAVPFAAVLTALVCLTASASAAEAPAADRSQIMAMAARVIEAANTGDAKAIASNVVPDADHTIIDNFPPFLWKGSDALSQWLEDYGRDMEAAGISDTKSKLGPAKYIRIDGDRAYVAVVDTYTYKRKGKPVRENLLWTFVASKVGADWKLISWSFAGGAKS
jgi:hypothetical protein